MGQGSGHREDTVAGQSWPVLGPRNHPITVLTREIYQHREPAAALHQGADRAALQPNQKIALPMIRYSAVGNFRELLHQRADELAAVITAEHGKVLNDALGEVARGLEVVEFACGMPHLLKGSFSEGVSSGVDVASLLLRR